MTHPFLDRLRLERLVISSVNRAAPGCAGQLAGLAPLEVERWAMELAGLLPEEPVRRVRRALQDLGMRIRAQAAASHRGVAYEPIISDRLSESEIRWIVALLTSQEPHGAA